MQRAKDLLVWLAVIAAVTGVFYAASPSTEDPSTLRPRQASGPRPRLRAPGSAFEGGGPPAPPVVFQDSTRFAAP